MEQNSRNCSTKFTKKGSTKDRKYFHHSKRCRAKSRTDTEQAHKDTSEAVGSREETKSPEAKCSLRTPPLRQPGYSCASTADQPPHHYRAVTEPVRQAFRIRSLLKNHRILIDNWQPTRKDRAVSLLLPEKDKEELTGIFPKSTA